MKHITFADKNLMTGNVMADLMIEFGAVLANEGHAESVDFNAYGIDGEAVTATLLLGAGAPLMAETTTSTLPEPDNTALEQRLRDEIRLRTDPPEARPFETEDEVESFDE